MQSSVVWHMAGTLEHIAPCPDVWQHAPIDVLAMCCTTRDCIGRTKKLCVISPYHVWSMCCIKMSMRCVLVGFTYYIHTCLLSRSSWFLPNLPTSSSSSSSFLSAHRQQGETLIDRLLNYSDNWQIITHRYMSPRVLDKITSLIHLQTCETLIKHSIYAQRNKSKFSVKSYSLLGHNSFTRSLMSILIQ